MCIALVLHSFRIALKAAWYLRACGAAPQFTSSSFHSTKRNSVPNPLVVRLDLDRYNSQTQNEGQKANTKMRAAETPRNHSQNEKI